MSESAPGLRGSRTKSGIQPAFVQITFKYHVRMSHTMFFSQDELWMSLEEVLEDCLGDIVLIQQAFKLFDGMPKCYGLRASV